MLRNSLLLLGGLIGPGWTALAAPPGPGSAPQDLYLRAERVILRPGKELQNATVLVRDGAIRAISQDLVVPEGAEAVEGKVLCAGFLDAWSSLGLEPASVAQGDSNILTMATDALDPFGQAVYLRQALSAGVTTVAAGLNSGASVRGVGTLVRAHADHARPDAVLLRDGFAGASVGLGGDLFDRVGSVERLVKELDQGRDYRWAELAYQDELEAWKKEVAEEVAKLEKGFKKAKKDREKDLKEAEEEGKEFKEKSYRDPKKPREPRFDAEKAAWARVVNGELPLVVEAHRYAEIRALLQSTQAYDRLRLILAGGTESRAFASQLKARRIPVIVWPAPMGPERSELHRNHDLSLAAGLAEEGVQVLFGSGGGRDARDLPLLAALAVGHGMSAEHALEALTLGPARALDLGDRLGQVRVGYEADLLLLDGDPVSSHTRVQATIVAGKVAWTPEDNQ